MPTFLMHDEDVLAGVEYSAREPDRCNPEPAGRTHAGLGLVHDHHSTPTYGCRLADAANRRPGAASGLGPSGRCTYTHIRKMFGYRAVESSMRTRPVFCW